MAITNRQALIAALVELPYTENLLVKCETKRELNGSETYIASESQDKGIDSCLHDIYLSLAAQSDYRQGSYSVQYSPGNLRRLAADIAKKWDLVDSDAAATLDGRPIM